MFKKKLGKQIVAGDIVCFFNFTYDLVLKIEHGDRAVWCDGLALESGEIDCYLLAIEHEYSVIINQ
jgi:hypothetical protein